jgi:glycyl-tRNA synthetase beta chain
MMGTTHSLLIEIGTEELPPKALDELAGAFTRGVCDGLVQRGIAADVANARTCCSPRRLAAWIPGVAPTQPDQMQERRGPALSAGLDANGEPTRALTGFAQSCRVDVAALEKLETDKGAWFVYRANRPGARTAECIPEILADALKALPIPRPMRWGDHEYAFVRPVHWLVVLHGEEVIPAGLFGVASGRESRGHRFHHPGPVAVASADAWLDALRDAKVLADPAERRARVRSEVARVAPSGLAPRLSDALLDEIANLTEWPVAIACTFDETFLEVPAEALVMTMETNQKFVPVFDADGALTAHFIGVANIESTDPAEIRKGYERVIRPRFADAKFFYDEDRKQPLAAYRESLQHVTWQQALGSLWDKSVRVAELARAIANRLRDAGTEVDAGLATHAAALSRCDLMTRMVGEFPELQGVMGRYYAAQGDEPERPEVAQAIEEFYRPRFGRDRIAEGALGQVLAIADRLDTLAGIFAVGMKPSGNKDPFALRRAALGLARTLIEAGLSLDLRAHLMESLALVPDAALAAGMPKGKGKKPVSSDTASRRDELAADLYDFLLDRLRGYYLDQGIAVEAFEAVRALEPADLTDFDARVRAVTEFARLPEAAALAAANKRIGNLLRQADRPPPAEIDRGLLEDGAETALADAIAAAEHDCAPLLDTRDYVATLKRLARLREPVDAYFDAVLVMSEDAALRANRLALLGRLRRMFLGVADIALLPHA